MADLFPLDPTGYTAAHGWRPLRLKTPYLRGWDVYDLQAKLHFLGRGITVDGIFGPQTNKTVLDFQAGQHLAVDGIAGVVTQTTLGRAACGLTKYPKRILGQVQKESSLLCGIYTPVYSNGSQDRGPCQENSKYFPQTAQAFDFRLAVFDLTGRIDTYLAKYHEWGVETDRAWAAAQGAWNRPAYADAYAKGQPVPDSFLEYIDAVTIYV